MAQVSVKYKCGSKVRIHGETNAIVTAIFIRGRGRTYEVSFTTADGPKCTTCEEVELSGGAKKEKQIGYN